MRIPCKILLLLLLFVAPFGAYAQKKDQTLLWRITGKGLKKPSYLFGTIHVTDKSLFNFGDSVYAAIQQTDGFAIEVNLNEMVGYYVNKLMEDKEDDKKIEDVFTKEELHKYKDLLAKKFKKDVKNITTKDIVKEKNKWMSDYLDKGEMPTIVDAYLYNIARRQGKWMGGIEDVADQMSLLDGQDLKNAALSDNSFTIDSLKELYISEDIGAIDALYRGFSAQYRDALLIRRNIKMARRMDSLMKFRSMFFAVGTAHLPGDSGVINNLRARGFTVEPVFSKHKTHADDYKFVEQPIRWYDVADEQNTYSISMPGEPASVKIYGVVEMKFLLELSNLSGFCTMSIVGPSGLKLSDDSIYHTMASAMMKKKNLDPPTRIHNGNANGVEYKGKMDTYKVRLQMYRVQNVVYIAFIYGKKDEYLVTDDAERFFKSWKLTPQTKEEAKKRYSFSNPAIGVSFDAPGKVEFNSSMTNQGKTSKDWNVTFYTAQDQQSGAYVMLISKEAKAGNYIAHEGAVLRDLYSYLKEKYDVDSQRLNLSGYSGYLMQGASEKLHIKAVTYVRSNRSLSLVVLTEGTHADTSLDYVFNTFKFLPMREGRWSTVHEDDYGFSVEAPSSFHNREKKNKFSAYCFDSLTTTGYNISADTLSKYEWASTDSSFLYRKAAEYIDTGERIIYKRIGKLGQDPMVEILFGEQHANALVRMKIVIHGNIQYTLFAGGDSAVICGANANRFFTSFKAAPAVSFDLHQPKQRMLFDDLSGADSAVRAGAYNALNELNFEKSDLPMLHDALFVSYPAVYRWGSKTAINQRIGVCISKLADASTVSYIRNNFGKLTGERANLQEVAIEVLARIKTKESYESIASLFHAPTFEKQPYYSFTYHMQDSLPLLNSIYPSIAGLIADTALGTLVSYFAVTLYDSGFITVDDIKRSENGFIARANSVYRAWEKSQDWSIYGVLQLLSEINTENSNKAIRQYLSGTDIRVKQKAALLLAAKNQKVEPAVWDSLASKPETRWWVYEGLRKIDKVFLFPKKYHTQKYFAEAMVYVSATENEDVTFSSIHFLSARIADLGDKKYKFYLYKVNFEDGDDTTSYLGVSDAYDIADPNNLQPRKTVGGIYFDEHYNAAELNSQFKSYLAKNREME